MTLLPNSLSSISGTRGTPLIFLVAGILSASCRTPPPVIPVLRTAEGECAAFRVPEGWRVVLGPASMLQFLSHPDRRTSEVELDGEAHFTVDASDGQPRLIVRAGPITVTPTQAAAEFAIRAFPLDSVTSTIVTDGAAVVKSVAPGAQIPDSLVVPRHASARAMRDGFLAMTEGGLFRTVTCVEQSHDRLVFRATPLREVVASLERQYDLTIAVEPADVGELRITAGFGEETPDKILGLLAATLGLEYVGTGPRAYLLREK